MFSLAAVYQTNRENPFAFSDDLDMHSPSNTESDCQDESCENQLDSTWAAVC